MYPSLINSFFTPPTIVVVSEERLKKVELEHKKRQVKEVQVQIDELSSYRDNLNQEIEKLDEPQSLEEALAGE